MQCQYCISLFVTVFYQQERHYRYRTSMTMLKLSRKSLPLDRGRSIRRILLALLWEPSCAYDSSEGYGSRLSLCCVIVCSVFCWNFQRLTLKLECAFDMLRCCCRPFPFLSSCFTKWWQFFPERYPHIVTWNVF